MKVFQSCNNTLYIANSMLREERRKFKSLRDVSLERFIAYLVNSAYGRLGIGSDPENIGKFLGLCKSLSNKDGDFKIGILDAHGKYYHDKWHYEDGINPKSVQKWINEQDGVYDLLLLHVCNPKQAKPNVKKSLAVVPTDEVCYLLNFAGIEHLLVIPDKGAVPFREEKITNLPSYNLLVNLQRYIPS